MSDLISREAMLNTVDQDIAWLDELTKQEIIDLITNAPAIEQGEAVYLVKGSYGWIVTSKESYDCIDDNYKRVAYNTPQQPQSVVDALEDVMREKKYNLAHCTDDTINSHSSFNEGIDETIASLRALIKRNAEEVECEHSYQEG
jgi:hypothetical protein